MKRLPLILVVVVLLLSLTNYVNASVLTFDDLGPTSHPPGVVHPNPIPNGYGGFKWDGFGYIEKTRWPGSGYEYGTVSGDYTAFYRGTSTLYDDGAFDFIGAYLTAAWTTNLNITVIGYVDSIKHYETSFQLDYDSPTWFEFNFLGINALRILSSGGEAAGFASSGPQWVMDDFTFESGTLTTYPEFAFSLYDQWPPPVGPSAVPEPATMLLLASGLVGLAGYRKFRKR